MGTHRRRDGFTLIELLIVIVVIAILALTVISRLASAGRRTREAHLRDVLRELRQGIEHYQADTGEYPQQLTDLVAPTANELDGGVSVSAKALYHGPYMTTTGGIQLAGYTGLPANPFAVQTDTDVTHHWNYDNVTGYVTSAINAVSMNGEPYSTM